MRALSRRVKQPAAHRFDRLAGPGLAEEVVPRHDVAGAQGRDELLADVDFEDRLVGPDRAARRLARGPTANVVVFQWPRGAAMTSRTPLEVPAVGPGHVGARQGLIDEDQTSLGPEALDHPAAADAPCEAIGAARDPPHPNCQRTTAGRPSAPRGARGVGFVRAGFGGRGKGVRRPRAASPGSRSCLRRRGSRSGRSGTRSAGGPACGGPADWVPSSLFSPASRCLGLAELGQQVDRPMQLAGPRGLEPPQPLAGVAGAERGLLGQFERVVALDLLQVDDQVLKPLDLALGDPQQERDGRLGRSRGGGRSRARPARR